MLCELITTRMTPTPSPSCESSSSMESLPPETLTTVPSETCSPATSSAIASATFSPGAVSGASRRAWADGQTLDLFGQPPAPASRSRPPATGSEPMIQGICGRTYFASSAPAGPLSSWESRLRERLAMVGSTESALIWREKITPAGALIYRLAPSTRLINGIGSTGSLWPTATALDGQSGPGHAASAQGSENLRTALMWPTCTARDGKGSQTPEGSRNVRPGGQMLNEQIVETADIPSGQTPNGSPAMTARRGAPNPAFPCWLMGFPEEWVSGAWRAMRSRRSSRRKSSARS